jgi:aldehyde dehydrogenase (NAD+)
VIINTFKRESDAVGKANNTRFGLYTSVFTKDFDRILRLTKILDAGTVCVNCTSPTMADDMPFGGHKMSGHGFGGLLNSMEDFLETKTILMRGRPLFEGH